MTPWSETIIKSRFNPEISLYHSILEKKYGRTRAIQILGLNQDRIVRRKPIPKLCKLCGKDFLSKSQKKVYCGKQDEVGTCSSTAMKERLAMMRNTRASSITTTARLKEIYAKHKWLEKPLAV